MMYEVKSSGDKFVINEIETGLILEVKKAKRTANGLCKKLNGGTGFEGNTPPFFCKGGYGDKWPTEVV